MFVCFCVDARTRFVFFAIALRCALLTKKSSRVLIVTFILSLVVDIAKSLLFFMGCWGFLFVVGRALNATSRRGNVFFSPEQPGPACVRCCHTISSSSSFARARACMHAHSLLRERSQAARCRLCLALC